MARWRMPWAKEDDILNTMNRAEPLPLNRTRSLLKAMLILFFLGIFVLISIHFITRPDPGAVREGEGGLGTAGSPALWLPLLCDSLVSRPSPSTYPSPSFTL